jgi:6,7-dimethyl-8-ribityllumazine synthase
MAADADRWCSNPIRTEIEYMNSSPRPHFLIVEARYYEELSDALLDGAKSTLDTAGATYEIATVPGALEIPATIAFALDGQGRDHRIFDGFVALGCVIRGETHHFEIVANESSRAISDLAIMRGAAIGNGILTVENEQQAWTRARREDGDKGGFAARAALAMVEVKQRFGD